MNNFSESYGQILKTLKEIEPNVNFLNQIRTPKLSDIELIAVALTAEYLSIDCNGSPVWISAVQEIAQ